MQYVTINLVDCSIVSPAAASDQDLRLFHSAEYLECLRRLSQLDDSEKSVDSMEEFGLGKQNSAFLLMSRA